MPIYPIIHKETGEQKEVSMSIAEWEEFTEENPLWIRDWSQGCASLGEIGEWKDRLQKSHPSWNEVLKKSKKAGGMNSKMENL